MDHLQESFFCPNGDPYSTYSCGENAELVPDNGKYGGKMCVCIEGYDGNPLEKCTENQSRIFSHEKVTPSLPSCDRCGINANCLRDHQGKTRCVCKEGTLGNAYQAQGYEKLDPSLFYTIIYSRLPPMHGLSRLM